jgi:hypothetical protein
VHLNTTDIIDMHALYSPEDIASFITQDSLNYKTTNILDLRAHSSHYSTSDAHAYETADMEGMPESSLYHHPATHGAQNEDSTNITGRAPLSALYTSETPDVSNVQTTNATDIPSLSAQRIRSLDLICSSIPEEPTNTKPTDVIDIPPPPPQPGSTEAQLDEVSEESSSVKTTITTDTTSTQHQSPAPVSSTAMPINPSLQFDMSSINLSQPTVILITPPAND